MQKLPEEVKGLQKLVRELMTRVASLEAENAELKRQLGRHTAGF